MTVIIDPPGPGSSLTEWRAFRKGLAKEDPDDWNVGNSIREADAMIAQLEAEQAA